MYLMPKKTYIDINFSQLPFKKKKIKKSQTLFICIFKQKY